MIRRLVVTRSRMLEVDLLFRLHGAHLEASSIIDLMVENCFALGWCHEILQKYLLSQVVSNFL